MNSPGKNNIDNLNDTRVHMYCAQCWQTQTKQQHSSLNAS